MFYLILQPTNYMDDNAQRYGQTFQIGAESESPLVYAGDPEMMVREIFTLDASTAETGSRNQVLKPMVGDRSILLPDGNPHRKQHKLLMPPFRGDRISKSKRTYYQRDLRRVYRVQPLYLLSADSTEVKD